LLERLLFIVGIVCLAYYGYVSTESALYQAYEAKELDAILTSVPAPPQPVAEPADVPLPPRARPASGSTIGRLEIPRLHVSAIVRAGSDARTLRLAIGHIGGTALPGEQGNVGLAAHRDTFFRSLEGIVAGDRVAMATARGRYEYEVVSTEVVDPDDTQVMESRARNELTLITCFPFYYVGSAPRRFVVHARAL
jgi:sortase A